MGDVPMFTVGEAEQRWMQRFRPPDWYAAAACRDSDPQLFFCPGGMNQDYYDPAREICARCPVTKLCLETGIAQDEHGLWGGYTRRERADIRAARRWDGYGD